MWCALAIDELIIRSLQGQATPAEEEQLRAWRNAALENERYYRSQSRAWRLVALIEPGSGPPPSFTLDAHRHGRSPLPLDHRRGLRFPRRLGWAAAIVALLAATPLALRWASRPEVPHLAAQEFITGAGERGTTRLNDGTVVRLAPNSRLRVQETGLRREVWLEGHAFFAVSREDGRQFVVRTRAGDAVVLGTRFDVRVEDEAMQVFVVEGRVTHQAGGGAVQVGAMELSRATGGGVPSVEPIDDPELLLSWLGDFLVFQSTPMSEIARELERRYGVRVQLQDSALAQRTVTAWFTDEPLDQVLLIVCRAADAQCQMRDRTISINP